MTNEEELTQMVNYLQGKVIALTADLEELTQMVNYLQGEAIALTAALMDHTRGDGKAFARESLRKRVEPVPNLPLITDDPIKTGFDNVFSMLDFRI